MRSIALLFVAWTLAGCAPSTWMRTSTATSVGCKPEQVKIVSKDSGTFDNIQSWTAECRGTRYRCVYVPGDKGGCYPATGSTS